MTIRTAAFRGSDNPVSPSPSPHGTALLEPPTPVGRQPRHVAIIMDGNGRWAQRRGYPRIEGHRRGVHSVRAVVEEGCRLGLEQLTLYCLSCENWKRPRREIDQLMRLLKRYLIDERPTIRRNDIRLRFIGSRDGLPADVTAEMDRSLADCAGNTGMILCLAINYGSRQEIVGAVRRIAADVRAGTLDPEAIDEDTVAGALDTAGMVDPDLVVRTAGEQRLSNYLLWQISYAEIYVTDTCWPDFRESELRDALAAFAGRERRFGGLG